MHFKEAIRLQPNYAEPHNNLGALHAQTGRFDKAQGHFDRAIELNPAYAQAYNNLGVSLLRQGLVRKAAAQLGQAVRIAPGYAKAHANLSVALAQLGQPPGILSAPAHGTAVGPQRPSLRICARELPIQFDYELTPSIMLAVRWRGNEGENSLSAIELYTWATPNGRKVSIMLEGAWARVRYPSHRHLEGRAVSRAFLAISPNNRIPAIIDPEGPAVNPWDCSNRERF